jgi:hypothetical protein
MNKLENPKYINTIPGYTRKGLNELKSKLNENN